MTPEIRLTGTPRIVGRDGVQRVPSTADARAALTRLVLGDPAGVTRAELADVLWPKLRPVTWQPQVRTIVGRVRALARVSALGANAVEWAQDRYVVNLPDDVDIDVRQAEAGIPRAQAALEAGDFVAAYELATTATRRLHGGLGIESISDWATAERQRCARLIAVALETATVAARQLGDPASVLVLTGTITDRTSSRPT